MKKEYEKPEVITQDFSFQIFLSDCWYANNDVGMAEGVCWTADWGCSPCSFPNQVQNSNMKVHP